MRIGINRVSVCLLQRTRGRRDGKDGRDPRESRRKDEEGRPRPPTRTETSGSSRTEGLSVRASVTSVGGTPPLPLWADRRPTSDPPLRRKTTETMGKGSGDGRESEVSIFRRGPRRVVLGVLETSVEDPPQTNLFVS